MTNVTTRTVRKAAFAVGVFIGIMLMFAGLVFTQAILAIYVHPAAPRWLVIVSMTLTAAWASYKFACILTEDKAPR